MEATQIEKTTEITTNPVYLLADAETTSTITTTTDEHPSTSTPRRHSFDTSNSTHYLPTYNLHPLPKFNTPLLRPPIVDNPYNVMNNPHPANDADTPTRPANISTTTTTTTQGIQHANLPLNIDEDDFIFDYTQFSQEIKAT